MNYFSISRTIFPYHVIALFHHLLFHFSANRRFFVIRDASHMSSALLPHRFTIQRLLRLPQGLKISTSLFGTAMISHRAPLVDARESQTKGEWQTQTSTSVSDPIFLFRGFGRIRLQQLLTVIFFFERNTLFPSKRRISFCTW